MKLDSEQDVDRILRALGSVEASAGMQQRVMAAVAQREEDTPGRNLTWGFAALAAAVVVAVFAVRLLPRPSPAHPPMASRTEAVPAGTSPVTVAIDNATPIVTHKRSLRAVAREPHRLLCDCDPTALAEANAPSQLAPELPMTEQEKLLRQVARHPDPVQVAELSAASREEHITAERDDFKAFFTPPAKTSAPE
jgi:hypothetical protein